VDDDGRGGIQEKNPKMFFSKICNCSWLNIAKHFWASKKERGY